MVNIQATNQPLTYEMLKEARDMLNQHYVAPILPVIIGTKQFDILYLLGLHYKPGTQFVRRNRYGKKYRKTFVYEAPVEVLSSDTLRILGQIIIKD